MRAIIFIMVLGSCVRLVLTPAGSAAEPDEPRKLALLVGIGRYEKDKPEDAPTDWKGWWNLASRTDVQKIAEVLEDEERFGFKDGDVREVLDEEATRENIIGLFRSHLTAQASPGDVIYFHYSGHGQQIADQNGDEFDGLDESLVPFDYVSQSQADGAKTNLRDDKLGELLNELKDKMSVDGQLRGSITVTLDSCFSGSGTRGELNGGLRARGRAWDSEIDGAKPVINPRGKVDGPAGLVAEGQANANNYVLLTAASYDQLAAETDSDNTERLGLFTDAWVQALKVATNRTTVKDVYEDVYGKVTARATRQDPTLEGNGDTLLFSGKVTRRSEYVVVESSAGNEITLPVGATFGVTLGSVYAVFKRQGDVSNEKDKIGEAVITQVRGASCAATLTEAYRGKLSKESLRAARAVEISHNYRNERPLRVFLADELPESVTKAISAPPIVKTDSVLADDYDVLARLDSDNKKVLILEDELCPILKLELSSDSLDQRIRDSLMRNWRKRFLMRIASPFRARRIGVEARLVPINVKVFGDEVDVIGPRDDARAKVISDSRDSVNLQDSEYYQLEVRNRSAGTAKVYFTVLHFDPDGNLEVDYPEREEASVGPGEEWVALYNCVYKSRAAKDGPPAKDVFKVFATREETGFGYLLPQRSRGTPPQASVTDRFRGRGGAPRGEVDDAFDLDRLMGYARLGRDPAPHSNRSENVRTRAADWNVTTLTVTTRAGMKK